MLVAASAILTPAAAAVSAAAPAAAPSLAPPPLAFLDVFWRKLSADQVLSPYVYVFYAAFLVAFVFTPVMRWLALYYGVIDRPDNIRKMHSTPVAYLGGVAVFLGWLAGLVISQYLPLHRVEPGWPTTSPVVKFSIVMGALVIIVLGLWDDIFKIKPWVKIGGQVLAAMFLLWDNVGVTATRPILGPIGVRLSRIGWLSELFYGSTPPHPTEFFPDWFIYGTSSVLVVLVVVICCNASNLMDGLDGLCGGVTAIIATGFLIVAVHLAMTGTAINTNWDALRVILGLALLGAVLGFVPYNFNPASIFMGDTGSMLLGFSCATSIILMAQERAKWFLAAMVMFALPLLDTTLAMVRRYINGRPIFSADRQHFHHQLVARGFSVKQTVMISYGLAIMFGCLGVLMLFVRTRYAVGLYLVIFGSIIVAAYKMGMVHERPRLVRQKQLGDDPEEASAPTTPVIPPISPDDVIEIPDAAPALSERPADPTDTADSPARPRGQDDQDQAA